MLWTIITDFPQFVTTFAPFCNKTKLHRICNRHICFLIRFFFTNTFVICRDLISLRESLDSWIVLWSRVVRQKHVSILSLRQWPPVLASLWYDLSRFIMISPNTRKMLYFYFHSIRVKWPHPSLHVTCGCHDHVIFKQRYISTSARP